MDINNTTLADFTSELLERVRDGASESDAIQLIQDWATFRCKETAKNVIHKACEIYYDVDHPGDIDNRIMNIQFKDVSPFE